MKDLLKYILENIVDNPDDINISESKDETGLILFNVTVAESDMGKVIGKGGKVINAIRQIIKIKSIKLGQRVNINLQEPPTTPTTESNAKPKKNSKSQPKIDSETKSNTSN